MFAVLGNEAVERVRQVTLGGMKGSRERSKPHWGLT